VATLSVAVGCVVWLLVAIPGVQIIDYPFLFMAVVVGDALEHSRFTKNRLQQASYLSTSTANLLGSFLGFGLLRVTHTHHAAPVLAILVAILLSASTTLLFRTAWGDVEFKLARFLGNAAGVPWGCLLWNYALGLHMPTWLVAASWVVGIAASLQFAWSVVFGLWLSVAEAASLVLGISRRCPKCKELIPASAQKCRLCGHDLRASTDQSSDEKPSPSNQRFGF